jgi:hypothetical protein
VNAERALFPVALVYLWILMILLGAIVLETFMVYPNIFRDPPASFDVALEFMSVRAPNDFFPPLGFVSWVLSVASLILSWRVSTARYWMLLSLLMILCEGVASMLLFWPRNEIMFVEGTAVHSAEFLRQTAREFQAMHWSRLVFNAVASVAVFVGFLQIHRRRVLSGDRQVAAAVGGS